MKAQHKEEMEMGFQVTPAGTYVWQIMDLDLYSGKEDEEGYLGRALRLSLELDSVVDGTGEVGSKASHFIWMVSKAGEPITFGEDQLCTVLTVTDMMDKFVEKFGENIEDPVCEEIVNTLKLRLPGNFLLMEHDVKDKNMNFKSIARVKGKTGAVAAGAVAGGGIQGGQAQNTPAPTPKPIQKPTTDW